MPTAFISGHLDITREEFVKHYYDKIWDAALAGHSFVVGDARGVDVNAQHLLSFLLEYVKVNGTITVYHMFHQARNCKSFLFKTQGGFKSDDERDAAMTAASDYDIAWVRPGRELSGTAKNIARRMS